MAATFEVDLSVPPLTKSASCFYPASLRARVQANCATWPWATGMLKRIIAAAEPWLALSDAEAWSLVVGPELTRSWHVWSTGYCPVCRQAVPMYGWHIDALTHPWKVLCPHCRALFPTNDFAAYYQSGLNEQGRFDADRADRGLLFNTEYPDPDDPRHGLGVDDGTGYREGDITWWFIGAYLIYGQWKQLVVGGAQYLASAYVVTGDPAYAHKAGILLDRVADLYPEFDFSTQAWVHDQPADGSAGYVSMWHDACGETRVLAMAYDMVFDAVRDDAPLVDFLRAQAARYIVDNPKATFTDIQRNIEDRLLRHPLAHRSKIMCNYPHTDFTVAVLIAVLGWPANREAVSALLDWTITHATAVDGTSGEKGMTDYSSFTVAGLGLMLAEFDRLDPAWLPAALECHPALRQTFRFHIDVRCLERYFPNIGDSGGFARQIGPTVGMAFWEAQGLVPLIRPPVGGEVWVVLKLGLTPSMYTFLSRLYRLTGDHVYLQRAYAAGGTREDMPYDLTADDPDAIRNEIAQCIAALGPTPRLGSVNKAEWRLAILRSGEGEQARAAWLHYASGGFWHGHTDGMNLGLFAHGLDLITDFGYPPLQFNRGDDALKPGWYPLAAAHNTVVVDGLQRVRYPEPSADGETTLWVDGADFQAIRVSGAVMIEPVSGQQYERTVALIDVSADACYLLDIFRVVGGADHAKFQHATFGTIATSGLRLTPAEPYGYGTMMRDFRADPAPQLGWQVEWQLEDRYGYLPAGREVRLRYTDLTADAEVATCEGWVSPGERDETLEEWIPRVMVRRRGAEAPLASTFVAVLEPYEGAPAISAIRRLPLVTEAGIAFPDACVAVEILFADGRRDLLIQADVENPLAISPAYPTDGPLVQPEWQVRLDGEMAFIRRAATGEVSSMILCHGRSLRVGAVEVGEQSGAFAHCVRYEPGK